MFELFYKKNDNSKLFKYLGENGFDKIQNYVPLFSMFFSLDKKNYNLINLNNKWSIKEIKKKITNNKFEVFCVDHSNNRQKVNSFFKFSPLLDPVKFMVGKYKDMDENTKLALPKIDTNICHKKVLDKNNSAYVDSFFSYLTSKMLHEFGFYHGLDFYGSFLSIQNKFLTNIYDDLEYLYESDFFHKNKNMLFEVDDIDEEQHSFSETRNYRKKITLGDAIKNTSSENFDDSIFENMFVLTPESLKVHDDALKEEYSMDKNNKNLRSSNTDSSDIEYSDQSDDDSSENNSSDRSELSGYSSLESDEVVNATVYNFPVQIICLEKMEDTLDSLLEDDEKELSNKEWESCLFQIIMILITYQKVFSFTHNDLHTNNIMYNKTDRRLLIINIIMFIIGCQPLVGFIK